MSLWTASIESSVRGTPLSFIDQVTVPVFVPASTPIPPTATLRHPMSQKKTPCNHWRSQGVFCCCQVYETAALPTELRRLSREGSQLTRVLSQAQGIFRATTDEKRDSLCSTRWLTNQLLGNKDRYLN
jgi:hypothetical protein